MVHRAAVWDARRVQRCTQPAVNSRDADESQDEPAAHALLERLFTLLEDVARDLPRERWAHVGELMGTNSVAATARAPGGLRTVDGPTCAQSDQHAVAILEWTG